VKKDFALRAFQVIHNVKKFQFRDGFNRPTSGYHYEEEYNNYDYNQVCNIKLEKKPVTAICYHESMLRTHDNYFRRFGTILAEKFYKFLKNQCYDPFFFPNNST
jgi:hypothetical protein